MERRKWKFDFQKLINMEGWHVPPFIHFIIGGNDMGVTNPALIIDMNCSETVNIDMYVDFNPDKSIVNTLTNYAVLDDPTNVIRNFPVIYRMKSESIPSSINIESKTMVDGSPRVNWSDFSSYADRSVIAFGGKYDTVYAKYTNVDGQDVIKGYLVSLPEYLPGTMIRSIIDNLRVEMTMHAMISFFNIKGPEVGEGFYNLVIYPNMGYPLEALRKDNLVFRLYPGDGWNAYKDEIPYNIVQKEMPVVFSSSGCKGNPESH